ncbi:hypothetical protein ColLi_13088 [Colletotrichum liriopes]|uniref:Uncharacterized protein n=1 Tax=Colletotrichum liriopes TaxID=708192 RepID=A0AA37LYE3_9PEZI|nr:hypothetical protein ColLi_13088 [Colletotrichum liriopes]
MFLKSAFPILSTLLDIPSAAAVPCEIYNYDACIAEENKEIADEYVAARSHGAPPIKSVGWLPAYNDLQTLTETSGSKLVTRDSCHWDIGAGREIVIKEAGEWLRNSVGSNQYNAYFPLKSCAA